MCKGLITKAAKANQIDHHMNFKTILLSTVMFVIVIISSWLAFVDAKKIAQPHLENAETPDFFMTNAVYLKMDESGQVRNQITATKLIHYSVGNTYFFDDPRMKLISDNKEPWYASANKGKSGNGKEKVNLWDHVVIHQAAGPNNLDLMITTEALTIYPDIKTAETNLPVTIQQAGSVVNSVGAKADFKTGLVKLLSRVKGEYKIQD